MAAASTTGPCRNCGAMDRYSNGSCKPCSIASTRARASSDETPRCSVVGCDMASRARGLCKTHYNRLRRGNDFSLPVRQQNGRYQDDVCIVGGCVSRPVAKNMCGLHYNRSRRIAGKVAQKHDPNYDSRRIAEMTAPLRGTGPIEMKRWVNRLGYVLIVVPQNTPGAPKKRSLLTKHRTTHMLEHRYVMSKHLGRAILPWETVHHKDGNRANNDISNLELRSGQHGPGIIISDGVHACLDYIERYTGLDLADRAFLARLRSKANAGVLGDLLPRSEKSPVKTRKLAA